MSIPQRIKIKKEILYLLFIVLLGLIFIWQPLIIIFFPGLLIVYLDYFRKKGFPIFVVFMLAISLSFWIVSFWSLKMLPIDLTLFARGVTLISVLALILGWKKLKDVELPVFDIVIVLVFVLVLFLRILPFFFQEAPAGSDMSMHCYMSRLIIEKNGVPSSYRPILPLDNFGSYPAGFHTITALTSLLSGLPVQKSGLLVAGLTHSLITFGLFIFLTRYFSPGLSLIVSLLSSFVVRSPQNYIGWGGNPTILSLFFVIMSFYILNELTEKRSLFEIFTLSFIFVAMPLTHPIPFAAFLYVFAGLSIWFLISNYKNLFLIKTIMKNLFFVLLFSLILLLPYLYSFKVQLAPEDIMGAFYWQQHEPDAFIATPLNILWRLPLYVSHLLSEPLAFISFLGFILMFLKKLKEWAKYFIFCIILAILIANANLRIIPLSYVLYPERMALLYILPFSIFSAFFFADLLKNKLKWIVTVIVIALIPLGVAMFFKSYLIKSIKECFVTKEDIKAMAWISKNTNKNDVFQNNSADAGAWLPAIAFRPVTKPHSEPTHWSQLKKGLKEYKAAFAYVGGKESKTVSGGEGNKIELTINKLNRDKKYRQIYFDNGTGIYKIIYP